MTHTDFHEVWWIYSPMTNHEWGGLRIAHFRKTTNGDTLLVTITGEIDQRRIGVRVWDEVALSERWYKVKQIPIPTFFEITVAGIDPANDPLPTGCA